MPQRILLGQLNSYGDCIFATTIAKQIKHDFPGCHLTWAIGSMCRSIIEDNPYIDEIWVVPLENISEVSTTWTKFKEEALAKKRRGIFNKIFFTQISPGNLHHYDGSIRASIFRSYPYPITVPITPVLRLTNFAIDKVKFFAEKNKLNNKDHIILVETSPKSGQSFLTFDFAKDLANKIIANIPNCCVILSSNLPFNSDNELIVDGSMLSLKDHAELSKYCTLLVGGSSGISWSCTADWATPLPMIQLLNKDAIWFNSLAIDHKLWNLPTDTIIEMTECSTGHVFQCISIALTDGFEKARQKYHENIQPPFNYFENILISLLMKGSFIKILKFYSLNAKKRHTFNQLFAAPLNTFIKILLKRFEFKK